MFSGSPGGHTEAAAERNTGPADKTKAQGEGTERDRNVPSRSGSVN